MNKILEVTCTYTNTHPYMYVCIGGLVMWSCEKLDAYRFCTHAFDDEFWFVNAIFFVIVPIAQLHVNLFDVWREKKDLAYFDVVRCCQSPLVNKSKSFIFFAQWAMKNDMHYKMRKNNLLNLSILKSAIKKVKWNISSLYLVWMGCLRYLKPPFLKRYTPGIECLLTSQNSSKISVNATVSEI